MKEQRVRMRELARITAAFARLDAIEDLNYPLAVVLRFLGLFFPLLIHYFLARLVDSTGGDPLIGSDYFSFAAVGLAVAGVLHFALNGFGIRLQIAQDRGMLESLLVEPVPWTFVPIAMNAWHVVFGTAGGATMLLVAVWLGAGFTLAGVPMFILVLSLGVAACTAIGIVSASILVLAKRSQPIVTLYTLLASLLGGAVFPIELLPSWLRACSYLVPHTYAISAGRQALMAEPPAVGIGVLPALGVLAAFSVVLLVLGTAVFARALHYARRAGDLGTY